MKLELKKNDQGFKEIKWIAKGLTTDKEDKRVFINHVYKDGNHLVSTDGGRLHMFEDNDGLYESLEDGFYEVVKNTKIIITLVLKFEKGEKLYPDIEDLVVIKDNFPQDTLQVSNDKLDIGFADIIRNMIGEKDRNGDAPNPTNSFRFDYFRDVLSSDDFFSVYHENENKPIYFKSGKFFAIIMPVRG
jgi:hypothetical protein